MMKCGYQLRSETTGLQYVHTITDALIKTKKDPSIWKISFNAENGDRIRLVKYDQPGNNSTKVDWVIELI